MKMIIKAIIPTNAIGVVVPRMPKTAALDCTSESLSKKKRKNTYSSR